MAKKENEVKGLTMDELLAQLEEQKKMIALLTEEKEKVVADVTATLLNDKSLFNDLLSKKQAKEKEEKEKELRSAEYAELWRVNSVINLLKNTVSTFFEDLPKSVVIKCNGKIITIKNSRSSFPDSIQSPINGEKSVAKTTTQKEVKTLNDGTVYKNCLEVLARIATEKGLTLTHGEKTYSNEAKKRLITLGLLSA